MKRYIYILSAFLLVLCSCSKTPIPEIPDIPEPPEEPEDTIVIQMDDKRELFVDNLLVKKLTNANIVMHEPKDEGVAFYFDKAWEGIFCGYVTMLKDGNTYLAYYRGLPDGGKQVTCYATSADGVSWTKPNLGIYTTGGSTNNNVFLFEEGAVTHNFSPFIDMNPLAKPAEKFKALGGERPGGLYAYASADGVHWTKMDNNAVFTRGVFDSQNVVFWSKTENRYICYFRVWSEGGWTEYKGKRTVARTTSTDFINWTEPVRMTFGDTPLEELYTQQTSPYYRAPHIYMAIGGRLVPNQILTPEEAAKLNVHPSFIAECSDVFFMTTRGGSVYDRTFMEAMIKPGIGLNNWSSRTNYPAMNVLQTSDTEMSLYVNQDYAQPSAHLRRYSMRIDGFASVRAPYSGGELLTRFMTFTGDQLEINYATSAAGEIKIEIQDEDGKAISGFTMNECKGITGNHISRTVVWTGKRALRELASQKIRLRISMKDADLYSLKFSKVIDGTGSSLSDLTMTGSDY